MNILVLGTIDNRGGAAMISWELRKRLKLDGHTVNTFVRYKYSNEADVFVIPRKRYQDWLVKFFANDLKFAWTNYLLKTDEFKKADIIHCHNLHSNFFDLKTLQKMSLRKPVIWTLHDMWAFTGFASDSVTLKSPNKKKFMLFLWDNTANLLRKKSSIYKNSKLNIVAVSNWLKQEASESVLRDQQITCIYNGVDTNIFKPHDKTVSRLKLKLPLDKKIIVFGIKGWMDSNKIVDDYINNPDIFFAAIGHSNIKTKNKNFVNLPYTENRELIALYLSAADIFLYPTMGDTFGLISAEAMACGIPVVTYNTDALPEIVTHKEVGYVARYADPDDAITGIEFILNLSKDEYTTMSQTARKRIIDNFNIENTYEQYLLLYKQLIKQPTREDRGAQNII